jgi:CHAD domain-containing protein
MTTDRTAIRRRLTVRRGANRPPWGGRKTSARASFSWGAPAHRSIVAPLAATLAATVAVGIGVAVARSERERRAARELPARPKPKSKFKRKLEAKRKLEPQSTPRRRRRFGLLREETAADGLQRIALAQLDLAIELLRGESATPPAQAVHETRKAIKRLRALMRLLEGEIGSKRAARERRVLSDIAGRLAGARDAEAMVDTLDSLIARHPRKLGRRRGVTELREHLHDGRRTATAQILGDAATRERVTDELCALRARVGRWRLHERRSTQKLVEPGLTHIYRAGRTHRKRAAARKPGRRALHKWRKQVKDLRYALEAIDVQGRPDKRLAKLATRADGLGELLGEEHDLMVLGELIAAHRPLKQRRRARRQLLRAISRRRARLRKRALREGARLYERSPKRFVRRLHT